MPVSCYECPMAEEMDMQEDWYTCNFLKKHFYSWDVTEDMKEYHRPKECPLVEVPTPHGRLIDADYLKEHIIACATNGRPLNTMELSELLEAIDDVPTVIEAEE